MSLQEYMRKRDFQKTAEPRAVRERTGEHRFVIQKHAASHLHYDFRLEMGGALKSWAVPKGLPYAKGEKRLALRVEDHPVSYLKFEGTIPEGNYGGGTVMVWDQGTFSTYATAPLQELADGKLHFTLQGKKLRGAWHLVRLRDPKQWLLIKGDADCKPVSATQDDTSALSGKTMAQLAKNGAVWDAKTAPMKQSAVRAGRMKPAAPAAPAHAFIEPMKACLLAAPPPGDDWLYEIKFDGYRAFATKQGPDVTLLSRNEKDFGRKFPEIVAALAGLEVGDAILDGEVVALDSQGVSSFQLLQAFEIGEERPPLFFYAFDLLRLNGRDLQAEPLAERKAKLGEILGKNAGVIRFSASLGGEAGPLLNWARQLGLEGLIGKRKESPYEAGRRSGAWIKLKLHREQEFVIGGYTEPEGTRPHFGALLVGCYEEGKLKFCGKVGTGFPTRLLGKLHAQFQEIGRPDCPFFNLPEIRAGRFTSRVTAGYMKRCHWVAPELVCQLKFAEWTRDGKLRQPVFLGLREDKGANEVVREKAA